jgi:hypothetical protein
MQLTLWFSQAVPRIRAAVSKDLVGMDAGDPARLEVDFVHVVSEVISAVCGSFELIVLRDLEVAKMIEGGFD